MKKIICILLFVLTTGFFWLTGLQVQNRTESEDVYEYALMVEQGRDHPWFYHAHHLLYGSLMGGVYRVAAGIRPWTPGEEGVRQSGVGHPALDAQHPVPSAQRPAPTPLRAVDVMRLLSALAAAGTLFFFFRFCYKRFSLRPVSSLIATAFLGVTYGFWRYSAESEIPLIASFLMMVALFYATDERGGRRVFGLAVFFSVISVLVHIMNTVAVFAAIPCYYVLRKRGRAAVAHIAFSGGITIGIYMLVAAVTPVHGLESGGMHWIGLGTIVKAFVAFCQCILSFNFALGFTSVRAFLAELFAGRMLLEEFYLGARLSRSVILFSTLTFLSFSGLLAACLFRAAFVWRRMIRGQERLGLSGGIAGLVVAGVWFGGYAFLLLFLEPGNPELWIMGLVPFGLLVCGMLLIPLTHDNRLWLPALLVLVLFIHNAGAMRMLSDPQKDYQFQKSRAVLAGATPQDVVVTAGNPVFERYLRYHFKGQVLYLHNLSPERLGRADLGALSGEVYILGDVFAQPRSLRIRFPEKTREIDAFAARIQPDCMLVHEDEFGGVYQLGNRH